MESKKRGLLIKTFFLLILLVLIINFVSALGIAPAIVKLNFEPGFEKIITYRIIGIGERELDLYSKGDLSKYVKFDRNKLNGGGEFTVILELPDKIETPGEHRILIGVREKFDEELVAPIGAFVAVEAAIDIFVPYPGKYLDVHLSGHDVNVNEPIKFELELISRGDEYIITSPKIDINSDTNSKVIESLFFQERELKSQEKIKLKKFLDTTNYNPGNYKAKAIVEYGGKKPAISEIPFRIGFLNIEIINYTKQIIIDKLARFDVEIQSGWNNAIDGVYADVVFLNGSKNLISFKTSTTGLIPWEKKTISGFFDTSNFTQGIYDANITLTYFGKDRGKSTSELVKVEFVKKPFNMMLIVYILAGLIVVVIVIILILLRKRIFKKKK